METLVNKSLEWWMEWGSTAILIVGVALTAYNIYPMNVWFSLAGNFGWFIVGWMWKKYSLMVIQIIISIIYIMGVFKYYGIY
jgi:hypothetical protein